MGIAIYGTPEYYYEEQKRQNQTQSKIKKKNSASSTNKTAAGNTVSNKVWNGFGNSAVSSGVSAAIGGSNIKKNPSSETTNSIIGRETSSSGSSSSSSSGGRVSAAPAETSDAASSYRKEMERLQAQLEEQERAQREAIEAQKREAERQRQASINAAVATAEAQRPLLDQQRLDAQQQAYIQMMQAKKALPQILSASGYTGGDVASANLGLETQYGNAYNNTERDYNNYLNQLDTDITNIKANGEISRADTASQYAQMLQQIAAQNIQGINSMRQQLLADNLNRQLQEEQAARSAVRSGSSGQKDNYDYKKDQEFAADLQMVMTGQATANDIYNSTEALIDKYGYDGYLELLGKAQKVAGGKAALEDTWASLQKFPLFGTAHSLSQVFSNLNGLK